MWEIELTGGRCRFARLRGETPEQALVRELKEELGITPVAFPLWNTWKNEDSKSSVKREIKRYMTLQCAGIASASTKDSGR